MRRLEVAQRGDNELEADDDGDCKIDQPDAVLALVARPRQAVDQADPDQISRRFRIGGERVARDDRIEPGPAGRDRESGQQKPLIRLADRTEAPDREAKEGRRADRVAPEADQRVHGRSPVNSTDMSGGVAKFYKYLVNGSARAGP